MSHALTYDVNVIAIAETTCFFTYILSPKIISSLFLLPSAIPREERKEFSGDSSLVVASNATKIEFTEKQFYVPVTTDYYRVLIAIRAQ